MPMHRLTIRLRRLTMRLYRPAMPMHCHLLKLSCVKYICAPTVSRRILHPNEMRYSLATFLPIAPFAQASPQLN